MPCCCYSYHRKHSNSTNNQTSTGLGKIPVETCISPNASCSENGNDCCSGLSCQAVPVSGDSGANNLCRKCVINGNLYGKVQKGNNGDMTIIGFDTPCCSETAKPTPSKEAAIEKANKDNQTVHSICQ